MFELGIASDPILVQKSSISDATEELLNSELAGFSIDRFPARGPMT